MKTSSKAANKLAKLVYITYVDEDAEPDEADSPNDNARQILQELQYMAETGELTLDIIKEAKRLTEI